MGFPLALALIIAIPAARGNIAPENVGKEAWIQNQANRPQAEAGELLQSLQGYMQQPPAQNAQYGYGAMPQQQPPLVTTETIAQAKNLQPGITVDKLSHKHEIRQAALERQLEEYSGYSPWFFVITFLFTVCAVIVAFFFAKGVWSQRQDLASKSLL